MDRSKRPSKFTIAIAAIVLLVMACIGILVLFRSGLLQRDAQAQGATVLQGTGLDGGSRQNVSAVYGGFGPLEGNGPLQGGGLFLGAGPLQGKEPILAGAPVGVGDPIPGPNGPPLLPAGPAVWPPVVLPTMPNFSPEPAQPPSDPTPPGGPSQQLQIACVTCFIPPPPPAPTPPPNNIVNCANVTCN
jgi:hypothetical protein